MAVSWKAHLCSRKTADAGTDMGFGSLFWFFILSVSVDLTVLLLVSSRLLGITALEMDFGNVIVHWLVVQIAAFSIGNTMMFIFAVNV